MMLIPVLLTDKSPPLSRSSVFSLLSKVRDPLLPVFVSFWGNADANRKWCDSFSPGWWLPLLLPGGARLAVSSTSWAAHTWSGILAGCTRAELLYPLAHLPIKKYSLNIHYSILHCNLFLCPVPWPRAESGFDIFKWLEKTPEESNILRHVKIMCP